VELYAFSDMSAAIDDAHRPRVRDAAQRAAADNRPKIPEPSHHDDFSQETVEYRVGQRVTHKLYGQGKILSLSGFGVDLHLTVLFSDGSHRKLMAKFANFEQVQ
jgi:hypothetical protein